MSEIGDREDEFENLEQQPDQQNEKIIAVTVTKGHDYIKNDQALESVILTPTNYHILFMQEPLLFAADGQEAAKVTKLNEDYDVAVKKLQEPGQSIEAEIQTIDQQTEVLVRDQIILTAQKYAKDKQTNTPAQRSADFAVQTNYVDIMQLIQHDEGNNVAAALQQQQEVQFQKKNDTGENFDETGTAYTKTTGTDDVSETATTFTTGTQKTANQSINSLDSQGKEKDAEKAKTARIRAVESKIFQDERFLQQLQLAELLVYQAPLLSRAKLYRGEDIVFRPEVDYGQILRQEFTVSKDLANITNAQNSVQTQKQQLSLQFLFTYKSPLLANMVCTCLDFSPVDERLIAIGYVSPQGYGGVAIFQPENPTQPKTHFFTRVQVTAIAWLPIGKSVLSVGFQDGTVSVFDLRHLQVDQQGYCLPGLESSNKTGKHSSKVTDLYWCSGDITGNQANTQEYEYDNLVSVSTDGRVVERSIKRNFEYRDILTLTAISQHPVAIQQKEDKKSTSNRMTIIRKLSAGISIDFLPDQTSYLVAGDDALVRKASRAYSEQTLFSYNGHLSSIYRVRVNPCSGSYFLSCSADRTTKIWRTDLSQALVTLRSPSEEHVYAAEWCPFKSTVLLTGSKAGKAELWDLAESTVQPKMVVPKILERRKEEEDEDYDEKDEPVYAVRAIQFNKHVPVAAIGYENGWVNVFRVNGLESGFVLRNVDLDEFLDVEGERISTVVQQQEGIEK